MSEQPPSATEVHNKSVAAIEQILNSGIDIYNRARMDGEIDLVTEVRNLMVTSGISQDKLDIFDANRFIEEAKDKNSNVQQYQLNRFFATQYMAVDEKDTRVDRYVLEDGLSPNDWLKVFEDFVIPTLLAYGLPKSLAE